MRRAFAIILLLGLTATARAQVDSARNAEADALWVEGKRLVGVGEIAKGCAAFEASLGIIPKLGTRLNLADCYVHLGRLASAWGAFRAAASQAKRTGDLRENYAREEADRLEPRLSWLTIDAPAGVDIRRDDEPLPATTLGVAIPVDPGPHLIGATAPGRLPWSEKVKLEEGERRIMTVPPLAMAPAGPSADEVAHRRVQALAAEREQAIHTRHVWSIAVGASGVALLGGATALGLSARSDWDASRSDCDVHDVCGPTGYSEATSARHKGLASMILGVAGVAAVTTGVVLWATSPPPILPDVQLTAGGAAFVLRGAF